MGVITIIGTIFSIWSVGISLIGENNAVKFRRYRKNGVDMKESKQLGKAMLWYKKALDHAETEEQESDIWWLITHIHTDRLIGASQQWTGCTGRILDWDYGPKRIPSNYNRPPREELLR